MGAAEHGDAIRLASYSRARPHDMRTATCVAVTVMDSAENRVEIESFTAARHYSNLNNTLPRCVHTEHMFPSLLKEPHSLIVIFCKEEVCYKFDC
jgi:hypothetical protein